MVIVGSSHASLLSCSVGRLLCSEALHPEELGDSITAFVERRLADEVETQLRLTLDEQTVSASAKKQGGAAPAGVQQILHEIFVRTNIERLIRLQLFADLDMWNHGFCQR